MMSQQQPVSESTQMIDDEIDLLPYIKYVFENYKMIIKGCVIATVIAIVCFFVIPKKYSATTSFIIPESSSSNSLGALSSFGLLSSSFSKQQSGIYSSYLTAIFDSSRIRKYVAKDLLSQQIIDEKIMNSKTDEEKIGYLISELNMNLVELKKVKSVYNISYNHSDPDIILKVLSSYMRALIELNEELNIDSDRLKIIVLDEAVLPTSYSSPNLKKLLLFLNFGVIMVTIMGLIIAKGVMIFKNKNLE